MAYSTTRSTFFCPAGTKWYWEFVPTTNYNYASCGITTNSAGWAVNPGGTTDGHGVGFYDVEIDIDGTRTTPSGPASTAWASGDIIGFAYDVDANTIKKYINGSLDYTFTSVPVSTDGPYSPTFGDFGGAVAATINVNFGQDSSFAGLKTAQGNQDDNDVGDFYYTPPTGYLALCTDNLSDPEIALPGDNFNTKLYTGDGATTLAVSSVGFQPDFTWIKNRDQADDYTLVDSVRGATNYIVSNDTDAEVDDSTFVASLDSDGFTVGDDVVVNTSTEDYASWNWKAGGAPTADNDNTSGAMDANSVALNGSLQAAYTPSGSPSLYPKRMSINTTNGFSIISYTSPGTDSDATIPHGLPQTPDMVIIKNLDSTFNWDVWGSDLQSGYDLLLNTTAAETASRWSTTIPTPSLITLKDTYEVNGTDDYIAYCFHSVEGYSKVGSYEGNGVDNGGPFVYTGHEPAMTLIKSIDQAREWWIMDNKRDPYNDDGVQVLWPNTNDAEGDNYTNYDLDYLSNGFKVMGDNSKVNESGQTYLFYSVAASPFKYSNAR